MNNNNPTGKNQFSGGRGAGRTKTKISGFGSELRAAASLNKGTAKAYNVRKAEEYLKTSRKSGNSVLIAYAQRLLNAERAK